MEQARTETEQGRGRQTKIGRVVSDKMAKTIVVEVTLKDQTQATHHRFEQRMRQANEVVECFLVSGPCDYVLRLACRDLDHYRDLTNAWTDDPTLGVEKLSSKPELQTIKPFRGYPLA